MIRGPKKVSLEAIFEKVSDYEIYRYYIGHDFTLGKTFCSPFRKENDPSFVITNPKSGKLKHLDYGDPTKRGDCVDFVRQLYMGMEYDKALDVIARDFGIKSSPQGDRKMIELPRTEKRETLIQVVKKEFDTADLKYWGDYHITAKELKENDVYSVKRLYVNRERIMIPSTELVYGYLMEDKWKIYRPFADKKYKWLSNIPHNYISNLKKITCDCKKGVITKAKKDEMVLSKFLPNVASVQSESQLSISKEDIDLMIKSCTDIYLNFDSDDVGVQTCRYYNQFGFKWINCPRGHYTPEGKMIKDFADLAKYCGIDAVINHFKKKGII